MFEFDDGGRRAAGFKGPTGDCCARAFAIVTRRPYTEIYNAISDLARTERIGKRKHKKSSARTGVYRRTADKLAAQYGLVWYPAMTIGSGCRVHVRADELPTGRLVLRLSRHYAAFVDGVLRDTYDCSRDGARAVYGYWTTP